MTLPLHHRPELTNIRSAYDGKQTHVIVAAYGSDSGESFKQHSSGSERSYRTQPTEYSSSPTKRPVAIHQNTCQDEERHPYQRYFHDQPPQASPTRSVESYASTVESEGDVQDELAEYDAPEVTHDRHEPSTVPASPSDFSDLFPSHRLLAIRHDDATLDGNMNLRIDTEVSSNSERVNVTLFHLRMHDLKDREFSLRRYCRDSGREVCHSSCKVQTAYKRPGFQRSLSHALTNIRSKSEHRSPTLASLKRNDSGYGSMHSINFDQDERPRSAGHGMQTPQQSSPDNIRLEFSNYAQVEVKRVKGKKRYEFEYWGATYQWRRVVRNSDGREEVYYQLAKAGTDHILAYVQPTLLTASQADEERRKGGWVPPCTMRIADPQIVQGQKDVSDVVVASGLIALVDDSIRARFHSKTAKHLTIPLAKMQLGVEYVGPKRLINEMFRRDSGSVHHSRPSSSGRPSSSANGAPLSRTPASSKQSSYDR